MCQWIARVLSVCERKKERLAKECMWMLCMCFCVCVCVVGVRLNSWYIYFWVYVFWYKFWLMYGWCVCDWLCSQVCLCKLYVFWVCVVWMMLALCVYICTCSRVSASDWPFTNCCSCFSLSLINIKTIIHQTAETDHTADQFPSRLLSPPFHLWPSSRGLLYPATQSCKVCLGAYLYPPACERLCTSHTCLLSDNIIYTGSLSLHDALWWPLRLIGKRETTPAKSGLNNGNRFFFLIFTILESFLGEPIISPDKDMRRFLTADIFLSVDRTVIRQGLSIRVPNSVQTRFTPRIVRAFQKLNSWGNQLEW